MKNLLLIFAFSACGFMANAINWKDKGAVPTPAKYESFEEGVPATWILQGKGKLSIDPWHYKLGKKSLQWDFKAGDIIKINNTIGEPNRRGGLNNREYASFGIWVYSPKAMKDKKLSFEFYSGDKKTAYFDFYLNYTGWQFGTVAYGLGRILKGKVSRDTDNIRIKAPAADGRVSIDLVVYNGPVYDSCVNILPSRTPWHARRLDEKKYPVPISVSHADKDAIANLEAALTPKISNQKTINKLYGHVTESIAMLNIIEDEHGIRGIPINTPRSHAGVRYTGSIYFYNGINQDKISGYKETMLYGTKKPCRILSYASTIACSLDKEKRKLLAQKIAAVWRYLIDQGVNSSSGTTGFYYAGTYIVLAKLLFVFADELEQAGLLETLFNYAQFKVYELFSDRPSVGYGNMDYFYAFKNYYYLAFAYSTDVCKRLQVLHYLKDRLDKDITSDLGGVGFKVDGSGFHDEAEHKNDYFGNALRELSTLVRLISHSSFAISPEAFNILKKCALNRCFYSNNLEFPIFMQGTGPMEKDKYSKYIDSYFPNAVLKNLALAAPGGCDKELAQAYVNLKDVMRNNKLVSGKSPYDNIFEKKYNLKPLGPPQGTISMPYTKLVAHRRDKWLAVAWGGKIDMRQRGNHYMYHGRNAPLSILGPEGFFGSGNQEAG